jgi:glycosyltransferase involved in cell wall biosynthesis
MRPARPRILSTLFWQDRPIPVWQERVQMIRPKPGIVRNVGNLLRRAGSYDALVLDGSGRTDQIAGAALVLHPHRPALVISDSTWKREGSTFEQAANQLGIRLLDSPRTIFCVHSSLEVDTFPRTWGPLRGKAFFTPFPFTIKHPDPVSLTSDSGRVFAGGNSLRDYATVLAAAPAIAAPIDIATTTLTDEQLASCPPNVTAGPLQSAEYDRRLFAASVVIVALEARPDRSSGQTTYVNAMALGKPIVITDTPGVRDYVIDGETGLIVAPHDPAAMARAVRSLVDSPELRRRIGAAARERATTEFTLDSYARAVLAATDLALASGPPRMASRHPPA